MGLQHKLAKMTAGTPSLEPGTGGEPELTGQDVAAAMGFVYGRVPDDCIGIHLVMAKYSSDTVSINILERSIARLAWLVWFDMGIEANVNRRQIQKLAELALFDSREPGKFQDATAGKLAAFVGVDYRTWNKGLNKVYNEVMRRLSEMEAPVLRILYRVLSTNR